MPRAQIDGQPVFYRDSGGDGPPVVFCHGFLMDHTMFDPQVEELAPDYRCVRLDERGFGGTPAPAQFTYWDLADDCVGLMDHLGIHEATLVGMSQGGFLSLRAALRHPDRVRALVLVDTMAGVDDEETRQGYREMFRTWMTQGPVDELVQEVAGLILGDDPELRRTWIARWKEKDPEELRWPAEALLERDDVSDRLGEIRCPALVVHGTDDVAIPLEVARETAGALPDCRGVVEVPGAAHAPNLSHPEIVNPRLRAFLAENA